MFILGHHMLLCSYLGNRTHCGSIFQYTRTRETSLTLQERSGRVSVIRDGTLITSSVKT